MIHTATTAPVGDVAIGGGAALHRSATITVTDEADVPYDLTLDVELDEDDGRYVVTRLVAQQRPGGPGVDGDGLRQVPIGRMLAAAMWRTTVPGSAAANLGGLRASAKGGTDDLAAVAATYRIAHACGVSPTRAVADHYRIPQSTAAKRVMRARELGLLEPTTRGKAGG
jgi:hypothetical protein